MKSVIMTVLIALLAGCGAMDPAAHSSAASGANGPSPGANPRLDKYPDDVFHSWAN